MIYFQSWIKNCYCRFIGYAEHLQSYRFEEVSTNKTTISRDAQYKEYTFEDVVRDYIDVMTTVDIPH